MDMYGGTVSSLIKLFNYLLIYKSHVMKLSKLNSG